MKNFNEGPVLFTCGLIWVTIVPSSVALSTLSLPSTNAFTTLSGLPVSRYALGGAARSTQPQSLVASYCEKLSESDDSGAPFFFYYNPHRYPAFMAGIQEVCSQDNSRPNVFCASGGMDRSSVSMDQRLEDALKYCGGSYLDMFVLEYVGPEEIGGNDETRLSGALTQARSWVEQGKVRYVAASTHSHVAGAQLAQDARIDAMMLRYSMSHKEAAEKLSLSMSVQHDKPVLAFTTTRWNRLQDGHPDWDGATPTTSDCISFSLAKSPPIEIVLHSARDEIELYEAMDGLHDLSGEELESWRQYGDLDWNDDDFDEYPEELTIRI